MKVEYIKGVHCGDSDCYSCGTMKGECSKLDRLDKSDNMVELESVQFIIDLLNQGGII